MLTSVILLNWNELHVAKHSIDRLLAEPDCELIVVDNGSVDGSPEYLTHLRRRQESGQKLHSAILDRNYGSSIARNVGINMSKGERIFLLDGDILYVPGTLKAYNKLMDTYPNAWCVGYSDPERVQAQGMNGTYDLKEARSVMPDTAYITDWFPMAWTQYGLFNGEFLRRVQFVTEGCFGEYGHGYEDDWLFHDIEQAGKISVGVNEPLYYHDAHYSLRMLKSLNLPSRTEERGQAFYQRWGENNGWREKLQRGVCHPKVFTVSTHLNIAK